MVHLKQVTARTLQEATFQAHQELIDLPGEFMFASSDKPVSHGEHVCESSCLTPLPVEADAVYDKCDEVPLEFVVLGRIRQYCRLK